MSLAKKFDPADPTPWLYSALLNYDYNRNNEAIADLEKSKSLNDNRSVFRSKFLLDQDQAVRGANLAKMYQDDGMFDVSVRESAAAVDNDYGNYSAHLFLANSYDALRDPTKINLRYETPWFSQLLVADLLAPVGAVSLSQNVSEQEYSPLFDGKQFGVYSDTQLTPAAVLIGWKAHRNTAAKGTLVTPSTNIIAARMDFVRTMTCRISASMPNSNNNLPLRTQFSLKLLPRIIIPEMSSSITHRTKPVPVSA